MRWPVVPHCDGNDGGSLPSHGWICVVYGIIHRAFEFGGLNSTASFVSLCPIMDTFVRFAPRLLLLRLEFLALSFFHRVCFIVTLNTLAWTCSLRCIDSE